MKPERAWHDPRRWLARLSFSFLIAAGFFAWRAYAAARTGELPDWQLAVLAVAAGICVVLALVGVRERHRNDDPLS